MPYIDWTQILSGKYVIITIMVMIELAGSNVIKYFFNEMLSLISCLFHLTS